VIQRSIIDFGLREDQDGGIVGCTVKMHP
jgi:hypothetical protein